MSVSDIIMSIGLGIGVSIPMGPIGILCVQRTLSKGRFAGFISGLGASVADTLFAAIAGLGLGYFQFFFEEHRLTLVIVGGILLLFMGTMLFLSNPIKQLRSPAKKSNFIGDFISVFFLTASNPMTIMFFGAMFSGFDLLIPGKISHNLLVVIFVFVGTILWWVILSTLVNAFRSRFRLRQLYYMNKIAGIVIFLFGIFAIGSEAIKFI